MFRIGEFSKISMVATSQLRFYDRIGLFQPVETDKFTGYRYYKATQLPDLNRILAMKELGLSLEQIQELVADNVSAEALRGMLALKKAQVKHEVQAQIAQLHRIDARLQMVEQEDDINYDDIVVKSLPVRQLYGFRDVIPHLTQVRDFAFELGKFLPRQIPKRKLNYLTVIQHADDFAMENADIEMGFLTNEAIGEEAELSDGRTLSMRPIEAVETAVCMVRVGGPDKSYACYGKLGRWAEANGYEIGGPVFEVFVVPPRPNRIAETVVEIQLPVNLRKRPSILI